MLCAFIMAGGSGQRFWPLSTEEKPKQLLKLFSEKSMIRETVDRILPLIPANNIFIGTNAKQAKAIKEELPMISEENIVIEPAFKDTAAAIGYGALYIKEKVEDACIIVLASDHLIQEEDNFRHILELATKEAEDHDTIVTLGIKPKSPETGYGYIETQEHCELESIYDVERFWEKPNKERAETYVASGNYLWNSGMFVFKATTILEEIERYMPRHQLVLDKLATIIKEGHTKEALSDAVADTFERFQKISIDFGVMERSIRIKVIPSDFGWNDIGSFSAFDEVFPRDENGNVVRSTLIRQLDSTDNIIISDHYDVAVIGVEHMVVVQEGKKLLICDKDRAQEIKKLL